MKKLLSFLTLFFILVASCFSQWVFFGGDGTGTGTGSIIISIMDENGVITTTYTDVTNLIFKGFTLTDIDADVIQLNSDGVLGLTMGMPLSTYLPDADGYISLTNRISSYEIRPGAITGPKIADNTITTDKIMDNQITGIKIADNSIIIANLDISNDGSDGDVIKRERTISGQTRNVLDVFGILGKTINTNDMIASGRRILVFDNVANEFIFEAPTDGADMHTEVYSPQALGYGLTDVVDNTLYLYSADGTKYSISTNQAANGWVLHRESDGSGAFKLVFRPPNAGGDMLTTNWATNQTEILNINTGNPEFLYHVDNAVNAVRIGNIPIDTDGIANKHNFIAQYNHTDRKIVWRNPAEGVSGNMHTDEWADLDGDHYILRTNKLPSINQDMIANNSIMRRHLQNGIIGAEHLAPNSVFVLSGTNRTLLNGDVIGPYDNTRVVGIMNTPINITEVIADRALTLVSDGEGNYSWDLRPFGQITGASRMDELDDVTISNIANNNVLTFSGGQWRNTNNINVNSITATQVYLNTMSGTLPSNAVSYNRLTTHFPKPSNDNQLYGFRNGNWTVFEPNITNKFLDGEGNVWTITNSPSINRRILQASSLEEPRTMEFVEAAVGISNIDEIFAEESLDTFNVLHPDGAGGVEWREKPLTMYNYLDGGGNVEYSALLLKRGDRFTKIADREGTGTNITVEANIEITGVNENNISVLHPRHVSSVNNMIGDISIIEDDSEGAALITISQSNQNEIVIGINEEFASSGAFMEYNELNVVGATGTNTYTVEYGAGKAMSINIDVNEPFKIVANNDTYSDNGINSQWLSVYIDPNIGFNSPIFWGEEFDDSIMFIDWNIGWTDLLLHKIMDREWTVLKR